MNVEDYLDDLSELSYSTSDNGTESLGKDNVRIPYDEYTEGNLVNPSNPIYPIETVSIVNSTDVHFGNKAAYHGPVTIKQYLYNNSSSVPKQDEKCNTDNTSNDQNADTSSTTISKQYLVEHVKGIKKWWPLIKFWFVSRYVGCATVIISTAALVLTIITTTIVVNLTMSKETTAVSYTKIPLGDHYMLPRSTWAHRQPRSRKKLQYPAEWVVFSHTAGNFCHNLDECILQARVALDDMMDVSGLSDVGHNFLIGGDGNIFEGRGWDNVNMHGKNNIAIGLIGNYGEHELNVDMINSIIQLLKVGVEMGKLDVDYKIIRQSQTYNVNSPGSNVYKIIKTWSNFYGNNMEIEY